MNQPFSIKVAPRRIKGDTLNPRPPQDFVHLRSGQNLPLARCLFLFPGSLALLLCLCFTSPGVIHADGQAPRCDRYVVPVHLAVLNLSTYHVVSWLCSEQVPGSIVQLTVHGATYNHSYWDFSCSTCQPDAYSYVQYMSQMGGTIFSYDRLGVGQSDHPIPEMLTIQSDAYVLSQLIEDLKSGTYGGPAFQKVLLVGHSVGSAISVAEAADPGLAHPDGVILTGFLHFVDPNELPFLATEIHPAFVDPDPRFRELPPGYLTTIPGTRGQLFYDESNVDPDVVAMDESTKEPITDSEFGSFFTIESSTVSRQIHVPVLEVLGQNDKIFCLGTFSCTNTKDVQAYEAAYYSPDAQLQVVVIPQAGHDLNLQKNAAVWEDAATQWINAHF